MYGLSRYNTLVTNSPIHIKFMTINVSKTNDEDEMKCHVNDI